MISYRTHFRSFAPGGRYLKPAGLAIHARTDKERPEQGRPASPEVDTEPERRSEEDPYILCRQCRQPVTHPSEEIPVNGAHRHTFANPHGMVFDIGCFRTVVGCGAVGPATDEFTWFPGYQWRVALCTGCMTHLGWLFTAGMGDAFAGLIVDRLVYPINT